MASSSRPGTRPVILVLIGAAVVAINPAVTAARQLAAPDSLPELRSPAQSPRPQLPNAASSSQQEPAAPTQSAATLPTLGELLDNRLQQASNKGNHEQIEQLGSLWLNLRQRDQLDRVVAKGERFIDVALRNQRTSDLRSQLRQQRFVPTDQDSLQTLAETSGWSGNQNRLQSPEDLVAAAEFVDHLDEPYRSAVTHSLTGKNRREVAESLGVSHAAVRKWMQRLRRRTGGKLAA